MISGDLIVSAITILISVCAFAASFSFPGGSSDGVPGAGFFPQILCVVMIVLSIFISINSIREKKRLGKLTKKDQQNLFQAALLFGSLILFVLLWGKIHFIINCSIFLILLGLILKQRLKTYIPSAIIASAAIYFIFDKVLQVMLNG